MKKSLFTFGIVIGSLVAVQAQTGNTLNGPAAGAHLTTGSYNTFIGFAAGYRTTTGVNNLAMGMSAGRLNTTGSHNVYIGRNTGYNSQTGNSNLFIGQSAGYTNVSGSSNIFIGADAGFYETGSHKLYISSGRVNPLIYGEFDRALLKINGTLAVGTNKYNDSRYKLYVKDGIRTEAVQIDAEISWPDYVFAENYDLSSLQEVEAFINENKHLPNVPSAQEVSEQGINVAEMDATLLRKIEELTLHTIQQEKEIKALKALVQQLIKK